MEALESGPDLLCVGEMGIGNTTIAAAVCHGLYGGRPEDWVGPGTGVDSQGLSRKTQAVRRAVALHGPHLGDPLEVLLLHGCGTTERVVVGPDLRGGERVQLLIPGNTFHTARLLGRRRWFLGASTEWPGVVPADVEIGDVEKLAAKYPGVAADLRAIKDSIRET
jgi:hypothetical protein